MTNKKFDLSKYRGITSDSRKVESGFIYVSIEGVKLNGDDFIDEAISRGATLVIIQKNSAYKNDAIEILRVENTRTKLAKLAHDFYQPQPKHIVAVTGTSGKTSVAFFYKQIAELLKHKSASVGTLGVLSNYAKFDVGDTLTSPDPITLNQILADLHAHKITHVAMEASSHGISQHRVDGIKFQAAAFTSFSQDHLDYHNSMEEYFAAKLKLFTEVLKSGYAVLNADIPEFEKISTALANNSRIKILSYGRSGNHIKLLSSQKPDISLEILGAKFDTKFYPEGSFQIYNLMAAIGLAIATGMKPHEIVEIVPEIKAAPGRMEFVTEFNGAKIFVDYAHKPDALDKALTALKHECKGKIVVVFGCGGDRDKSKRKIMGEIAARLADTVIVTDDNPRTEDASSIRKQVMEGCKGAIEFDDRAVAIAEAIKLLKPSDMLLIAGKGHETYQIIGKEYLHFSDHEEVLRCVG
ncbi:MAG: UDP-N-acetylmuramoyl-L-alanyl-D-glutamate--2,6-diaminopimelate ligase [Candidatus Jidaibacter sp.]|jgi:UDP-N-acetylmuramoyl-L-alanyl-D-glutamate--2,6-diaminopimelate ligase|nr:UDP-N-acetylmuramoyl-L-alanyl-D-glutamate--2,6-diaminopimelate ligase [Candidatus Jidaibacter sp.]